jgi:hypothetical protein
LLNATASGTPPGRLLDPIFKMFVAAGSPERRIEDILVAPFGDVDTELSRRVNAARTALVGRTTDRRYETFGLGFVGLLTGTVVDRSQ